MHDYKILLTWEAIYDIAAIADYIEFRFDKSYADRFQDSIEKEIEKLSYQGSLLPQTQILYRNYSIHKKIFSPSIIFYIFLEEKQEIHILRVLRKEQDWQNILQHTETYTYPE